MTYIVVRSVSSVRVKGGDDVVTWEPGDEVDKFPPHVNVKDLIAIGAIKEAG